MYHPAGGQGTRLNFKGPKGLFPISVVKKKTLFQLFAEKTLTASCQAGRPLQLAIMTSPLNDEETRAYFKDNHYFGLKESQVSFFMQRMLPFLNEKGDTFLDSKDRIAEGPDGNGYALKYFFESGIWQSWHSLGIRYVNVIQVDNPLADPFDAELAGYHAAKNSQVTLKATTRRDEKEKVGIIVSQKGKILVKEYSEVPPEEFSKRDKYPLANLSLFCFSMDFIQEIKSEQIPMHKAFKSAAWKFETYIFDLLTFAKRVEVLVYPREVCFSPLKNAEGNDSVDTVQKALVARDLQVYSRISKTTPAARQVELSQQFYYPTKELLLKWNGVPLPNSPYIEA